MKLRFLEGSQTGRTLDVTDKMYIGRENTCDIFFDDEGVSRKHACLYRAGGKYVVEDLGSTNGVRVNGKRINKKQNVQCGDRIGIGVHVLLLTDDKDILPPEKLASPPRPAAAAAATVSPAASAPPAPASAGHNIFYILLALIVIAVVWVILMPTPSSRRTATHNPPPSTVSPSPPAPSRPAPRPHPRPNRPTIQQPDRFSSPRKPNEPKAAGYFWIASEPTGAKILVDDTPIGSTPLILQEMTPGVHSLKLQKDGYEEMVQAFYIPHTGKIEPFKLTPKDGVALITSEPNHVSVWSGTQLLGTTPFIFSPKKKGEYVLLLAEYGYESKECRVNVSRFRSKTISVKLRPITATLSITTIPANAEVFIDGLKKGITIPSPKKGGASAPLVISGLAPGKHSVRMKYNNYLSPIRNVFLNKEQHAGIRLYVWVPDSEIITIDGKKYIGMIKKQNNLGDIVLALSARRDITLIATQIQQRRGLSKEEVKKILDAKKKKKSRKKE